MVRLLNVSLYPVVTVLKLNAVLVGFFLPVLRCAFALRLWCFCWCAKCKVNKLERYVDGLKRWIR